ncbi:hypothetical protein ACET3Z_031811 [Daucus carota]
MNSMERLPVDMIGELLEAALGHGFQCFYNLFKAWAQSQRTLLIREMLGNVCRSRLFRFWKCGSSEDMALFEELMDVACHMGIALLSLHQNNLYRQRIVSDVESVEVIYRLAVPLGIPPTVDRLMSFPLHSTGDAGMFISNCLESEVKPNAAVLEA